MITVAEDRLTSSEEAFGEWIVGRAASSLRLARWILGDETSAEEAVQSAALLAWRRRKDLRDPSAGDAWFNRILVNVCRTELRRRGRQFVPPTVRDTYDPWQVRERDQELAVALGKLDDKEQVLLALRYGRELTIPAIAQVLNVPDGTVKSRIHFALQHLRAALDAGRR